MKLDRAEFGPLVSAAWLRAHAGDPDVRVLDVRWYLAGKKGADEYARGHVPGARFVDLATDLAAHEGPGRHPLPAPSAFRAWMRRAGIAPDARVVAYDDAGGSVAARAWWLLRRYGHAGVAVLDGGLQAWVAAGGALTTDPPPESPVEPSGEGASSAPPDRGRFVDKGAVARTRGDATVLLLDARALERYRGDVEPVDARPGHIPGAKSAPFAGNLAPDGTFRSPAELRARYEALGAAAASEVVVYCGSGVTACHDLLALEIAGIDGAKLYEGSWSDWARDASLQAATGDEPG